MANRKCIVCGAEYSYCPTCSKDRKKPRWMSQFDKEDCKIIFETGCAFEQGTIDASEASKKLQGKNLSNIISPSLKETLGKLGLAKKESEKKEEIKKVEVVKEEKKPEKSEVKNEDKKDKKFFS